MYSQYQDLLLAVVRRILHKNPKGVNRSVVFGVSFGYKDLCNVGTIATMCCNSA